MAKQPEHSPANLSLLDQVRIEPSVKFSPARWSDLVKESEEKRKHFEGSKSTRPWSRWRELRGIAAEEVVSVHVGIPRHKRLTDGGEDFFRCDVKGIPPVRPVLAVVPVDGNGGPIRWIAAHYIAVVVDIREHWGAILGWAYREEVREAQKIQMPNAKAHVLYPWELHEGLPPELVEYARVMKATRRNV